MPGTAPAASSLGSAKGTDPGYSGPPRRTRRGNGGSKGNAIGEAALTGPGGRQLEARVQSGAITSAQAKRTMQQRQTLAKALGSNWREKLQVGGESFAQVNKGLKANPDDAKLAAIRKKLLTNRQTVLEEARAKNKSGTEGEPDSRKRRRAIAEGQAV